MLTEIILGKGRKVVFKDRCFTKHINDIVLTEEEQALVEKSLKELKYVHAAIGVEIALSEESGKYFFRRKEQTNGN